MTQTQPTFRFWSRYAREYLYEPKKFAPVSALLCCITMTGLFIFGIKPMVAEIQTRQQMVAERKELLQSMTTYLGTFNEIKPIYDSVLSQRQVLNAFIPDGDGYPNLIKDLNFIAAKNGMVLALFAPEQGGREVKQRTSAEQGIISLEFQGDLGGTVNLIQDIENSPRFIGIRDLTLRSGYYVDSIQITAVVYFMGRTHE